MVYSIIQKFQLEGAKRLDAEYYQPEFLVNAGKIDQYGFQSLQKFSTIDITKGETPLWRGDDYKKEGIPFLRSENLIPSDLDLSNTIFISEKVHQRMKRSVIYPNDILLAIVGATIGKTGLVTDHYQEYNSNQANAIIRPQNKKQSHYLSIVLETKLCQLQIERLKGGGARDNLDLHEVKVIKIPKPTNTLLNYCDKVILETIELRKQGQDFYSQAEQLLLKELNLENFGKEEALFSVVNLKDIKENRRMDAEFFNSDWSVVENKLKDFEVKKLGELVEMKKGIEPGADEYREAGKQFIRVSSMTKYGINQNNPKYLSESLHDELRDKFEPQIGEILLTKDASPGIAFVLKEKIKGIISGGILRLKLKGELQAEYLSLVLNSVIGQLQAERDAGGSIIKHWRPEQIKNVLIPVLPKPTQQKIADLVHQSHEARKKAKELLEEAKQKVERIIEK